MWNSINSMCLSVLLALSVLMFVKGEEAKAQIRVRCVGFSAVGGISSTSGINLLAVAGQPHPVGASFNSNHVLSGGFLSCFQPNEPPIVLNSVPDTPLTIGGSNFTIDLNSVFIDPNGDSLSYSAISSNDSVARPFISDDILLVSPISAGNAIITVKADDGNGGSVSVTFGVTVTANTPPSVANPIPDIQLTIAAPEFRRNLKSVFNDPDGDELTYSANSSDDSVAIASISADSILVVLAITGGNATIRIIADDGRGGTDSTTFNVTVNTPPSVANRIDDIQLTISAPEFRKDLKSVFDDPDGDVLSYSASSSADSVAIASISADSIVVSLTNPAFGDMAIITVTASDGRGGLGSTKFKVTVESPPQIMIAPPPTAVEDTPITIVADIRDNFQVDNVKLNIRTGGDTTFFSVLMDREESLFSRQIPKEFITARGLELSIEATDNLGLISQEPASGFLSIRVQVPAGIVNPTGSVQNAYRLVSFPLSFDGKQQRSVLTEELGEFDKTRWRFLELRNDYLELDPEESIYTDFPEISEIEPGKGYWLFVKEQGERLRTSQATSFSTSEEFGIPLHQGWNLIGNPFNFPVPISNIRLNDGNSPTLRTYTGEWNDPTIDSLKVLEMQPFEGYALFSDGVDTLLINPDLSASSSSFSNNSITFRAADISWSLHILAQCREARDVDNIAAVASIASKNWDKLDLPEPPVIGEYVSVYFPHPEWNKLSKRFCTDFRPESSDGHIWEFEVKTNIRDKVHLTFEGVEGVPKEFEVWLVDEAVNVTRNLREVNRYSVAGVGEQHPKRLKLVVGKEHFIAENVATTQNIPSDFVLSQNFPNPFNPVTTIRYGLPKDARVTVKVYNILGEEVVTLVDDERKTAGFHVAIWDGRNQEGRSVASGVYVYRLSAGSFSNTKKMALVR